MRGTPPLRGTSRLGRGSGRSSSLPRRKTPRKTLPLRRRTLLPRRGRAELKKISRQRKHCSDESSSSSSSVSSEGPSSDSESPPPPPSWAAAFNLARPRNYRGGGRSRRSGRSNVLPPPDSYVPPPDPYAIPSHAFRYKMLEKGSDTHPASSSPSRDGSGEGFVLSDSDEVNEEGLQVGRCYHRTPIHNHRSSHMMTIHNTNSSTDRRRAGLMSDMIVCVFPGSVMNCFCSFPGCGR